MTLRVPLFAAARRRPPLAAALAFASALAALAGCGGDDVAPTSPAAPAPAVIEAYEPAPRSTHVPLETEIHADFSVALDPATLTTTNVFLKVDTRRIPIALTWNDTLRRLTIVPQTTLFVGRTHTIEITPRVMLSTGDPVAAGGLFWQFTTAFLRPLRVPAPADRATGVSPFTRLRWEGPDPAAGSVAYRVWTGPDSADVANRVGAGFDPGKNDWIPRARWAVGGTTFWSVRQTHVASGEVSEGAVWRFKTLPATTRVDTVTFYAGEWGYVSQTTGRIFCFAATIQSGTTSRAAVRWLLPADRATLQFAGAEMYTVGTPNFDPARPVAIRATEGTWTACALRFDGPPYPVGPNLAVASAGVRADAYRFQGDAFTAHLEAWARDGDVSGYVFASDNTVTLRATSDVFPDVLQLKAYLYRPAPGPALAPAAAAPARAAHAREIRR
jgi:hypothetical protein